MLGDSRVVAIGTPFGVTGSTHKLNGHCVAIGRIQVLGNFNTYETFIQTRCLSINPVISEVHLLTR